MRYLDPESVKDKRIPSNYNARQPYTRPHPNSNSNRPRPPHQQPQRDTGERWQRGFEARPEFQREQLDRELDRWGTKAQKEGGGPPGRGFDDWRTKRDGEWADDRKLKQQERDNGAVRRSASRSRSRSPVRTRAGEEEREEVSRVTPARGEDRRSQESDMVLDLDD